MLHSGDSGFSLNSVTDQCPLIPLGTGFPCLEVVENSYALSADWKRDRHPAAPFLIIIFEKLIYF